eukprot:m.84177 g.84177  ORF g.84177 m.84177 type:complete len:58 (+) comp8710_c0_seq2:410-583(+)
MGFGLAREKKKEKRREEKKREEKRREEKNKQTNEYASNDIIGPILRIGKIGFDYLFN